MTSLKKLTHAFHIGNTIPVQCQGSGIDALFRCNQAVEESFPSGSFKIPVCLVYLNKTDSFFHTRFPCPVMIHTVVSYSHTVPVVSIAFYGDSMLRKVDVQFLSYHGPIVPYDLNGWKHVVDIACNLFLEHTGTHTTGRADRYLVLIL